MIVFDAQERESNFEPLPPTLARQEIIARDVRLGDWIVFDPRGYDKRRDWVQVDGLWMDAKVARFEARGSESIQVPIDQRVKILRALPICSVRQYVGEGRDRQSVAVCKWHAGHGGKHEWEYAEEAEEDGSVSD